jgi:hypothetical protein
MIFESLNPDAVRAAVADSQVKHFNTTFEHLGKHFGIRRGCFSLYMGTTSCGKSSLMKTLSAQASATPGVQVLHWLSEEKKEKYAKGMDSYCQAAGIDITKIRWFEESSLEMGAYKKHEDFLGAFKDIVVASGADIVFIDNISTSRLYGAETPLWDQAKTVTTLKRLSQDLDIAIVCVIHTSSNVSDNMGRLFTTEDVRGSKSIGIEASYFYSLQKFTRNNEIFLTLRTLKFREHDNAGGTYLLKYDPRFSVHTGDLEIDFNKVNEIFKNRDHLGRR